MNETEALRCELLVLRWRGNDESAARELTELFLQRLLYYLRRLLGSEADAWDVAQETWMAAFRSLSTLRDPRTFPAFLFRIARNKAISHLRNRRAEDAALLNLTTTGDVAEMDVSANDSTSEFNASDAVRIHQGLDQLSLPHREVLTLYFLEDWPIRQIATVIGVPEGTIKSRLFHAKKALRQVLEKEVSR